MGIIGAVGGLNPAVDPTPAVAVVTRPIVEGLFDLDAAGRPRPWLAEEVPARVGGGISDDGRVIIIRLRQGVAWDDGRPFGAADLAFTAATYRHPDNRSAGPAVAAYQGLRAVDALDAYTVRLEYDAAGAPWPRAFSPIFPAHLFGGVTRVIDHPYSRAPLGSGPFRFREWVPGERLTLARSPSYREQDRPYLDEIVFHFFADETAAADRLRAGALDLLLTPDGTHFSSGETPPRNLAPRPDAPLTWNAGEWRRRQD